MWDAIKIYICTCVLCLGVSIALFISSLWCRCMHFTRYWMREGGCTLYAYTYYVCVCVVGMIDSTHRVCSMCVWLICVPNVVWLLVHKVVQHCTELDVLDDMHLNLHNIQHVYVWVWGISLLLIYLASEVNSHLTQCCARVREGEQAALQCACAFWEGVCVCTCDRFLITSRSH